MIGVTLGEIFMAAMSKERLIQTFLDYARDVNTKGASEPVAGEDTPAGELLISCLMRSALVSKDIQLCPNISFSD